MIAAARSKGTIGPTTELSQAGQNLQNQEPTCPAVAAHTGVSSVGPKDLPAVDEVLLQGISEESFFLSTKLRLLLALLETDVTAGRSCVIFSQWTSMLDLLEIALERAEAARSISAPVPDGAAQVDDNVEEVGATLAGKHPAQQNGGTSQNKGGIRGGQARVCGSPGATSQARLKSPMRRLYNYRRIDGSVGLEARQRTIKWFTETGTGSTAPMSGPSPSTPAEEDNGPFLGRCGLKPFSCEPYTTASPLDGAPASSRRWGSTTRPASPGNQDDLAPAPPHVGKILLLSLKTGNVGLNLVRATRCYLVDGWWNPQVERQAMRRLWRYGQVGTRLGVRGLSCWLLSQANREYSISISLLLVFDLSYAVRNTWVLLRVAAMYGQDQAVSVYRFVCARTVEERMEELLEWKDRLSRNTLRRDDGPEQGAAAGAGKGDDENKRKGRLSLQDLKKLFEGWDADEGPS